MSILVIRFCSNVFSVKRFLWRSTGTLNCRFVLFLIISFSRFQYFSLYFGSLKLCFTNLVLKFQDNLSLFFSVFIRDIKLDLFYSFSAIPYHYGSYLKNSSPCLSTMPKSNSIQSNQVMILWPLFGLLDRESWVV